MYQNSLLLNYLSKHVHFITNGSKRFLKTNPTDSRQCVPFKMYNSLLVIVATRFSRECFDYLVLSLHFQSCGTYVVVVGNEKNNKLWFERFQ